MEGEAPSRKEGRGPRRSDSFSGTPSIKAPECFDGTQPFKVRSFIQYCKLIFHNDPAKFSQDRKKVFQVSSLLIGRVAKWIEPYLSNLTNQDPSYLPNTWKLFKSQLFTLFGDPNEDRKAEVELDALRIKEGGHVSLYISESRSLVSRIGHWGERALIHHFRKGLPSRILDHLASHPSRIESLQDLMAITLELDTRYHERHKEKSHHQEKKPEASKVNSSHPQSSPNSNKKKKNFQKRDKPHSSLLKKDFKLMGSEKERIIKEGLCAYCGEKHSLEAVKAMEIHSLGPQYVISMPYPIYGNFAISIIISQIGQCNSLWPSWSIHHLGPPWPLQHYQAFPGQFQILGTLGYCPVIKAGHPEDSSRLKKKCVNLKLPVKPSSHHWLFLTHSIPPTDYWQLILKGYSSGSSKTIFQVSVLNKSTLATTSIQYSLDSSRTVFHSYTMGTSFNPVHLPIWKVNDTPKGEDLILGFDFLNHFNPSINWGKGLITFNADHKYYYDTLKSFSKNLSSAKLCAGLVGDSRAPSFPSSVHIPSLNSHQSLLSSRDEVFKEIQDVGEDNYVSSLHLFFGNMDLPPSSYHDSLEELWDEEEEPEEIKMVMKVVPSVYHQYLDVFSKLKAEKLPPHMPVIVISIWRGLYLKLG
ncbi:hypothetical protein O181_021625 [Austropuccinia psidii MF-1]|uniref:Retrotransposon gag domain-containing protein n=1 Tax=Austropuccinia psidii MF-1 TaxID=1389203 RepID=A0A9Q3CEY6_9BASI|nr:hypothetical protein [Austropuccinia psidii MF-1]